MAREDLYVGLSRARNGTRLYVAIATDPGEAHPPEVAGSTRQVLTGIIDRTGVEPTATETVRTAVAGIGDLRRMAGEYEYAIGTHVGDHYRIVAEQHHPGITADRAWPSVAQRLHLGEAHGVDPDQFLTPRTGLAVTPMPARGRRSWCTGSTCSSPAPRDNSPARRRRCRPGWPPSPPAQLSPPWDTYLPGRYDEMDHRISTLVAEAEKRPARLVDPAR